MPRGKRPDRSRERGFTLIEVLVALALVAVVLVAIGSLFATNARGVRALEQHAALMDAVRLVAMTGIPRTGQVPAGDLSGETAGHRWQIRSSPFFGGGPVVSQSRFLPMHVELRVRSPSGAVVSVETVRLLDRSAAQ